MAWDLSCHHFVQQGRALCILISYLDEIPRSVRDTYDDFQCNVLTYASLFFKACPANHFLSWIVWRRYVSLHKCRNVPLLMRILYYWSHVSLTELNAISPAFQLVWKDFQRRFITSPWVYWSPSNVILTDEKWPSFHCMVSMRFSLFEHNMLK